MFVAYDSSLQRYSSGRESRPDLSLREYEEHGPKRPSSSPIMSALKERRPVSPRAGACGVTQAARCHEGQITAPFLLDPSLWIGRSPHRALAHHAIAAVPARPCGCRRRELGITACSANDIEARRCVLRLRPRRCCAVPAEIGVQLQLKLVGGTLSLAGGVAERSNAAVSKTVSGGNLRRGFKSLPLR